jgi:hypothetical protein
MDHVRAALGRFAVRSAIGGREAGVAIKHSLIRRKYV